MRLKNNVVRRQGAFWVRLLPMLLLCSSVSFSQDSNSVALVIYPEVRAPFSKVFEDIVAGFDEKFQGNVKQLKVNGPDSLGRVSRVVDKDKPGVVLALGKRSYDLYQSVGAEYPVLLGATGQMNQLVAGISMIPDAEVVLGHLLKLSPGVKKVHVIRRRDRLQSIVERAEKYLTKQGVALSVIECDDLQAGAAAYRTVLDEAEEGEAIWVLPGSSLLDNAVLSLALKSAWQKNLVMFSSNPLHVKRGMLFAVYPDNRGMGGSLAAMANNTVSAKPLKSELAPLRDVLVAVNERTSRHLAIELTSEMKSDIDLLLPAR